MWWGAGASEVASKIDTGATFFQSALDGSWGGSASECSWLVSALVQGRDRLGIERDAMIRWRPTAKGSVP